MMGMPRRVYTYAPNVGWNTLNLVSSIGAYILATSFLLFIYNIVASARSGEVAGDNPWRAWTLEWATTSPPPHGNFRWRAAAPIRQRAAAAGTARAPAAGRMVARVTALTPAQAARAARSWPGAAAGEEGTAIGAEPEQSTIAPFFVAVGFLLVAIGLLTTLVVTAIGGAFLLLVAAVWMSQHWTEPMAEDMTGHRFSFMGLAMLVFIGSESVFFAALIAADIHLHIHNSSLSAGRAPARHLPGHQHAEPGAQRRRRALRAGELPQEAHRRLQRAPRAHRDPGRLFLGGQAWEYTHLGFGLSEGLLASTFYTLTGFHGLHVMCGLGPAGLPLLPRPPRGGARRRARDVPGHQRHGRRRDLLLALRRRGLGRGVHRRLPAVARVVETRQVVVGSHRRRSRSCWRSPCRSWPRVPRGRRLRSHMRSSYSSMPAADASVPTSPTQILLTFSEPPDPKLSLVKVVDSAGRAAPGVGAARAVPGQPARLVSARDATAADRRVHRQLALCLKHRRPRAGRRLRLRRRRRPRARQRCQGEPVELIPVGQRGCRVRPLAAVHRARPAGRRRVHRVAGLRRPVATRRVCG